MPVKSVDMAKMFFHLPRSSLQRSGVLKGLSAMRAAEFAQLGQTLYVLYVPYAHAFSLILVEFI